MKELKTYEEQMKALHKKIDLNERIRLLKKLKSCIEANEDRITEALQKDFSKPPFETYASEILMVYKEINVFIKNLRKWAKPKRKTPALLNFPSKDYIYREPWGHVLVIAPWNYPFQLAINPALAAFASGNRVILKPSELTQHTSEVLESIAKEVFPSEYLSVVQGGKEVASELLQQKWNYIFFTGSVAVGKIVAKAAAEQLCPTTLELGGKNPCIIDKSANLKIAAKRIVWGKFLNAGQTCIAPDYLLVHKEIEEEFTKLLTQEITNFYSEDVASSPDFARIVSIGHFERLVDLLKGEKILFGGRTKKETRFIEPTLVKIENPDAKLMQEEIFGPILPIISFQNTSEIETWVNKHPNPLAFYIFSEEKEEASTILSNYNFGGGVINDTIVHFLNDRLPFGGVGNSGMGQYHGKHSFETFTRPTTILHRSTFFDVPLRYAPYNGRLNLLKKIKALVS